MGKYNFKYVDLFAGIGGFHQAMRFLGGECVMASEIDYGCIKTYQENYDVKNLWADIRKIEPKSIPPFDVLCAGFPCQPFSKAGSQKGFQDEHRGNLFYVILDILDEHPEVRYILLENVRNLADKNENWDVIKNELMKRNFYITEDPVILSPSNFGIPQARERVYILGLRKDIRNNNILKNGFIHREDLDLGTRFAECQIGDAWKILETNVPSKYRITNEEENILNAWNEFLVNVDVTKTRPIWVNYFGVNYLEDADYFKDVCFDTMPKWKKTIVQKNRNIYKKNKIFIDNWIQKYQILDKNKLFQKFEWNCGSDAIGMQDTIIQIRQSGIRFKRSNFFPALVAMVNTPIIWDRDNQYFRRITPREAANIQNFNKRFKFIGTDKECYKQLGNSVNVKVLKILGDKLFRLGLWGNEYEQEN